MNFRGAVISDSFLKSKGYWDTSIDNAICEGGTIIENGIEGGNFLLLLLFGKEILYIAEQAKNFLFSENLPTDLREFQETFDRLNVDSPWESFDILYYNTEYNYIGECSFHHCIGHYK